MYNTFEIKKFSAEIKSKNRKVIKTGCCLEDIEPESIKKFETLEAALEELKKYKPSCYNVNGFYHVEEYMVECYEVDEDGDFVEGSDYYSAYEFIFNEEEDKINIKLS